MPLLRNEFVLSILCTVFAISAAMGQPQAINEDVEIDQTKLLNGDYTLRTVVESGRHFFSTPFNEADGFGEGHPDGSGGWVPGPRQKCFNDRLKGLAMRLGKPESEVREILNFPPFEDTRFLRFNGLDSQSCFECHNAIGSDRLRDTDSLALSRKVGVVGGAAGFASSAFINSDLPDPMFMLIRNAPFVLGTGYAQQLADEMTLELWDQRKLLVGDAVLDPGAVKTADLSAKGLSFGKLSVKFVGGAGAGGTSMNPTECSNPNLDFDYSKLEGVSCDLVVRPFQWKGIASNMRNFVKDALNFHFGILAIEKHLADVDDPDLDNVPDEISIGDVTALTAFAVSLRPPQQIVPPGHAEIVERGRQLFSGKADIAFEKSCAKCHQPMLTIYDPNITILTPERRDESPSCKDNSGITHPRESTRLLPVAERAAGVLPKLEAARAATTEGARTDQKSSFETLYKRVSRELMPKRARGGPSLTETVTPVVHYSFDLTTLEPVVGPLATPPTFTQPRLHAKDDGSIDVPLYSDLRRHKMGPKLADRVDQQTDVKGVIVPKDQFLTRPLWGVADSGPWMHDGRALSLRQAIMLHKAVAEGGIEASEANDSIMEFENLPLEDQEAVIEFLLSLRLPTDPRYAADQQ